MPLPLPSSLISSLNALPHKLLVIDSYGLILFINDLWKDYWQRCGLTPADQAVGAHYLELFEEMIAIPVQLTALNEAVENILQGGGLISSNELILRTVSQSDRIFLLEVFPLLTGPSGVHQPLALSLHDRGPAEQRPAEPSRSCLPLRLRRIPGSLVPICASCKSIRDNKEEWITVERFLQQQLSLQFTHDICPDCIRQLYPKYAGAFNR
ncbi:hypothetical protein D3C73_923190 [compost metagenome]